MKQERFPYDIRASKIVVIIRFFLRSETAGYAFRSQKEVIIVMHV